MNTSAVFGNNSVCYDPFLFEAPLKDSVENEGVSPVVFLAVSFVATYAAHKLVDRISFLWRQREKQQKTEEKQTVETLLVERRYQSIKEIPETYLSGRFSKLIPCCPITKLPIRHPVIDPTSKQIFEKEVLETWVKEHGTSPLTRKPLKVDQIQPDPKTQFWIEFFLNSAAGYLQKKKLQQPSQ